MYKWTKAQLNHTIKIYYHSLQKKNWFSFRGAPLRKVAINTSCEPVIWNFVSKKFNITISIQYNDFEN